MKKSRYTMLGTMLAAGVLAMNASPLTPEQALARVENLKTTSDASRPGLLKSRATGAMELKYTLDDNASRAAVYVFGTLGSDGFLVVSADDAAAPLLGYSYSGSFDPSDIPPSLAYLLDEYAGQIADARSAGVKAFAAPEAPTGLEAIGPLLKSKWNQGAPYNKDCFVISSTGAQTQSVTGCVATSMAQVMYYFKQPAVGKGEISYKHGDSGTYTMNFAAQDIDWDSMLPTYLPGSYTAAQADAVAYLMKACGYSVKMDYSKGDAGANGAEIATALITYFGYNPNIEVQTRAFYTYADWVQMIYDNLKNVGPVVYNGSALDGGHSFVCDGYDGEGYFHINWGWGGMSDGYYLLDALNPDEFGIGGAAGGYNLGQQVILNISPENTGAIQPALMQFGTATGKISGNVLSISLEDSDTPGLQYINPTPVTLTLGVKAVNTADPDATPVYFESSKKNLEAKQGSFYHWDEDGTSVDLSKAGMAVGDEFDFILSSYITQTSGSAWSETVAVPGRYNYVTVKRTASGYEVVENTVGEVSVSNFKVVSDPVYWNMPVEFSATFGNESSTALTRNYSAVFFDSAGKEVYKMENYSINVDAGATLDDSWTSVNWYKENGATGVTAATQFTVKLYDNWMGKYVDGVETTVTVEPEAAAPKVESTLKVLNGELSGDEYIIDGNTLEVALTVKVTEGVFNHTLMLALQEPMADGDYYTVMHKHFDAIPNLTAGQEQTYTMSVTFDDLDYSKVYRVEVWGPDDGFNEKVLVKFTDVEDGVAALKADANGRFEVYSLDGRHIGCYSSAEDLDGLPSGVYVVNGTKVLK